MIKYFYKLNGMIHIFSNSYLYAIRWGITLAPAYEFIIWMSTRSPSSVVVMMTTAIHLLASVSLVHVFFYYYSFLAIWLDKYFFSHAWLHKDLFDHTWLLHAHHAWLLHAWLLHAAHGVAWLLISLVEAWLLELITVHFVCVIFKVINCLMWGAYIH